jgi:hypothetical protein
MQKPAVNSFYLSQADVTRTCTTHKYHFHKQYAPVDTGITSAAGGAAGTALKHTRKHQHLIIYWQIT